MIVDALGHFSPRAQTFEPLGLHSGELRESGLGNERWNDRAGVRLGHGLEIIDDLAKTTRERLVGTVHCLSPSRS